MPLTRVKKCSGVYRKVGLHLELLKMQKEMAFTNFRLLEISYCPDSISLKRSVIQEMLGNVRKVGLYQEFVKAISFAS